MQGKPRFDANSPEIKSYLDALAHQFVSEGTMVAFPTCLPGMTTPIPHEESRITALDISPGGHVYGGTSGPRARVFAAAFHNLTGIVLDLGAPYHSTSTVAICCGTSRVIAFLNGPQGGRAVGIPYIKLAQDWIQEWGLDPTPLERFDECVRGEAVVHAVCTAPGDTIVGVTTRHLFTMEIEAGKIAVAGEVRGNGQLALARAGVFGRDEGARLWRFDVASGQIRRNAIELPAGEWNEPIRWARDPESGLLFTADDGGSLFAFDEDNGFRALGKTNLAPAGPMAVAPDGRLFGSCGTGIANLFCCDTRSGGVRNLGVAAAVLQHRRYGYQFGAAVTGPEGEIVFGENDNSGHLWLHFPRIAAQARA